MSSPNHPTSNKEDAFSSNFPNYLPASLDYIPTSQGKTYSSSSNSFGIVPLTSPTLSLFMDASFHEACKTFYTENHFPPPIYFTSLQYLKPRFFYLKRTSVTKITRSRSSSTSSIPQSFEIGERLSKRHSIDGVLSTEDFYLEVNFNKLGSQITKSKRKQICSNHKISLARFRITELGYIINDMQIRHQADIENLQDSINELENRME
ncbi:hypothetical protein Tco_0837570 [Tanacetum coccineum]